MFTATVDEVDGARLQPEIVIVLVTAAPASGMLTSVPLVPVQLPPPGGVVGGVVGGGVEPPVQVGSLDWAGTLTAVHAALTVLNSAQLPGKRFFAACSVQMR